MAALADHLLRGRPVVLGTTEADGRVVQAVRDRIDLGRRLARAVAHRRRRRPGAAVRRTALPPARRGRPGELAPA